MMQFPEPLRALARPSAEAFALGALLFVTRFLLQASLAPQVDQECHIGGIAVDLLAHGVRFPLLSYAPNEYDNGSFVNGALAALSFTVFGRSVLALKLVTHAFVTVGAFATLSLLRTCLDELGWTGRRERALAIAALIIGLALAPRFVAMMSMYAVGNHVEGAAIDVTLLAIFAGRAHARSPARTVAFWALVGAALYVNKGTILVIPVLAVGELAIGWHQPRRLAAAASGLVLGVAPEIDVVIHRHARGWQSIAEKASRGSEGFPASMIDGIVWGADRRTELLVLWAIALVVGLALAWRTRSVALRCVVGLALLHLAALGVMSQGGPDQYTLYGHPTIVVLVALVVGLVAARAPRRSELAGLGALAFVAVAHRPSSLRWDGDVVADLWRDRAGAACSWRFAEGFGREHGLAPGDRTREEHELARCRTLSEREQVASCIGGMSRELHWRRGQHVAPVPPASFDPVEAREYAYWYGTHRDGDTRDCADFEEPSLRETCIDAVRLDCLVFADLYMRIVTGERSGRPNCEIAEPPIDGFWGSMRRSFMSREPGRLVVAPDVGETDPSGCAPMLSECYPSVSPR